MDLYCKEWGWAKGREGYTLEEKEEDVWEENLRWLFVDEEDWGDSVGLLLKVEEEKLKNLDCVCLEILGDEIEDIGEVGDGGEGELRLGLEFKCKV